MFFNLEYGDRQYTNKSFLDKGKTILISSQGIDNGAYGFFDIPSKYKQPIITVPRTGSIGFAFVQLFDCNVTDDCIILTPKRDYSKEYLFYIAAIIRRTRWRYNYGRKITPLRIASLNVIRPDEFETRQSYNTFYEKLYPIKGIVRSVSKKIRKLKTFSITELFLLERGQFHAIDRLEKGKLATISRISTENGLVGFYEKPSEAKEYPPLTITVSTVTGHAFLQINPFIATDNVVICKPKKPYKITTLLYIQAFLNKVKWRYSYGRQCYKRIFQKTIVFLPITNKNEIDEEYIAKIVKNQPYWKEFEKRLLN